MRVEVRILGENDLVVASESFTFGRSNLTDEDLAQLAKGLMWHWDDEVDFLRETKDQNSERTEP